MEKKVPEDFEKFENEIKAYFHCKTCMIKRQTQILAIGWTIKGLQVWCETCDENIIWIDFQGQKHPAVTSTHVPIETPPQLPPS